MRRRVMSRREKGLKKEGTKGSEEEEKGQSAHRDVRDRRAADGVQRQT